MPQAASSSSPGSQTGADDILTDLDRRNVTLTLFRQSDPMNTDRRWACSIGSEDLNGDKVECRRFGRTYSAALSEAYAAFLRIRGEAA